MRAEKLHPGFSTADAGYPQVQAGAGLLIATFPNSSGQAITVRFDGVAAYRWQECMEGLAPGEPWDGTCELHESSWLAEHPPGSTMYAVEGLRHIRLNFNAWGRLDVLCKSFASPA